MNEDTDEFEDVLLAWFGGVAKMVDIVRADIDKGGEFEVVINLGSPHIN